MKQLLLTVTLFMTIFITNGQSPLVIQWEKTIGSSGGDVASDYKRTLDKGYILIGLVSKGDSSVNGFHTSGYYDSWIVKLDSNRNLQWNKCFGGTRHEFGKKIIQIEDSGYIALVQTESYDGDLSGLKSNTNNDLWVFRISKTGDILWNKLLGDLTAFDLIKQNNKNIGVWGNYGGEVCEIDSAKIFTLKKGFYGSSFSTGVTKFKKLSTTGYIGVGYSSALNLGSINNHGGQDIYITKLDSNYNTLWANLIGTLYNDGAYDVIEANDGGFFIGGFTLRATGATLAGHHGDYDYLLVKVDKNGNEQWHKYYGGSNEDFLRGMVREDNNGIILYGTTNSTDGDANPGSNYRSAWLIKVDTLGAIIWQKGYRTNGSNILKMEKDADSNYLICGSGNDDFWLAKLAPAPLPIKLLSFSAKKENNTIHLSWETSTEINTSHFNIQRSLNAVDFINVAKINAKGLGEYFFIDKNFEEVNQMYYRLEIVDKDGSITYGNILTINNKINLEKELIFPNPAQEQVTITGNFREFKIIDNKGNIVISRYLDIQQKQTTINISQLNKGVYFIQCTDKDKTITKKLIVE